MWKPGRVSAASITGGALNVLLPNQFGRAGMKSTVTTFGCGQALAAEAAVEQEDAIERRDGELPRCALRVPVSKLRFLPVS